MTATMPDAQDYIDVYRPYGDDMSVLYRETDVERYRLLFERILRLLKAPSAFNLSLPEPFRNTALNYLAGHPETVEFMSNATNRHYMLSDLYDWVQHAHSASKFVAKQ